MGSPSTTSAPPPASSWATPPEFYADENVVGRSVRRLLSELGYAFHTPGELFGSWDAAQGARDEAWLARVSKHRWAVLNRDTMILRRADELAAYRAAGVHMFYLPGQATVAQLVGLLATNLAEIGTETTLRAPRIWYLTPSGLEEIVDRGSPRAVARRPRS